MSETEQENQVVCFLCGKVEENTTRVIECIQCCRSVHFRCKKIIGTAIAKVKQKPYLCSTECSDQHRNLNQPNSGYDELVQEIRALATSVRETREDAGQTRSVLEHTRQQLVSLVRTTSSIEESQVFLANKFDALRNGLDAFKMELTAVKRDNLQIKSDMASYERHNRELTSKVDRLEVEMDKMNRNALSKNAVILGLPTTENENVLEMICKVGTAVNCQIDVVDIACARRLPSKDASKVAAPILVTFKDQQTKEKLFECKRSFGVLTASNVCDKFENSTRKITIRDEMTAFGRELLQDAKNLQEELNIKYVWPGRNGQILIRRLDGGKIQKISSKQELSALSRSTNKRGLISLDDSSSPEHPVLKRFQN